MPSASSALTIKVNMIQTKRRMGGEPLAKQRMLERPALSPKWKKSGEQVPDLLGETLPNHPVSDLLSGPPSALVFFPVLTVLDMLLYFSLLTAVLSFASCFTPVPRRVPVTLNEHLLTEYTGRGACARKTGLARESRDLRNSKRLGTSL